MPLLPSRAPGLNKPKSKLRLRLGFTESSPKSPATVPHQAVHFSSLTSNSSSQTSSASHTTSSTANPPTESLTASTNTTSSTFSGLSRGDSRSAFALEISPSTASERHPNPEFDTISYATASPLSSAFDRHDYSTSTLALVGNDSYPSTSSSTSHDDDTAHYDQHERYEQYEDVEEEEERPMYYHHLENDETMANSHPGIVRAAAGADDIFYISDDQLGSRFSFYKEIGFGNWGSVWIARPRLGALRADGMEVRRGRKSAAYGGGQGRGKVAVKLVHRQKSDVSLIDSALAGVCERADR